MTQNRFQRHHSFNYVRLKNIPYQKYFQFKSYIERNITSIKVPTYVGSYVCKYIAPLEEYDNQYGITVLCYPVPVDTMTLGACVFHQLASHHINLLSSWMIFFIANINIISTDSKYKVHNPTYVHMDVE